MAVLGVDFGTSNSAATVFKDGYPVNILHQNNNSTMPSFVAFNNNERLIGEEAEKYSEENPENVIYEAKKFLGKTIKPQSINEYKHIYPFRIVSNEGKPAFKVNYMAETKTFCPEQIAAMIMAAMKENAEHQLNESVTDAVITVPAGYTQSQRQATMDAAEIAGLKIITLMNEPTAAAVAYGFMNEIHDGTLILVFDFGGGTLDVSIVRLASEEYTVMGTRGNQYLGGSDITFALSKIVLNKLSKHTAESITKSTSVYRRFLLTIESAKKQLSDRIQTTISINTFIPDCDITVTVSRADLYIECNEMYESIISILNDILLDVGIKKDDINEVVFVGGASKTPRIRTILADFFPNVQFKDGVDPELAVAQGAAIRAAALLNRNTTKSRLINIIDVAPLSLGIRIAGDKLFTMIPRNTPLPIKKTKAFGTFENNQTYIDFKVFEGEHILLEENRLLIEFTVNDIPPGPPKKEIINLTFEIDKMGMLLVRSVLRSNKETTGTCVQLSSNNLEPMEIQRMKQESEHFKENDRSEEQRITAKIHLEVFANEQMSKYEQNSSYWIECNRVIYWCNQNPNKEKEDFDKMKNDLSKFLLN